MLEDIEEFLLFHERLDDILIIEKILSQNRLLLNPYNLDSDPSFHLVNYPFKANTQFKCLLDRNVVSYLIG
jgi:hypothetical protein